MIKRNRLFISFLIVAMLFSILSTVAWRVARSSVANEGYDTDEAAWNYLVRGGEIRFRLRDGSEMKSLTDGSDKGIISSSTEAYVKLGYGNFSSTLTYQDRSGKLHHRKFITSKFNHWNRVLYVENEDGDFDRYDNGVLQEANCTQMP